MREAALPGVKCASTKCGKIHVDTKSGKMFRERWKMLAGGVIKVQFQGVITGYLCRKVH